MFRYLAWSPLAVIALAVAALGVTQNARYGAWLDAASAAQTLTIFGIAIGGFGVTFAVLNAFKVLSLPAIIEAWGRGHRGIAATCAVGFCGLALLSIWNGTALQTIARDDKSTRQAIERQRLAGLKSELTEVEVQSKSLGETRLAGEIAAALSAMRVDRRWSSSNECRDATATASRTFCAAYSREFGELTRANAIEQLRLKGERLRTEIAQRTTAGAVQQSDPELQKLADATGLDAANVGWWRALVYALIFELVEAFALALAWVVRPRQLKLGAEHSELPSDRVVEPPRAEAATCPKEILPGSVAAPPVATSPPALKPAPKTKNSGGINRSHPTDYPALRPALTLVSSFVTPALATPAGQVSEIRPEQAVAAFVDTLSRSASARTTAGELLAAYEGTRDTMNWPHLTSTAFGRHLKTAIERAGGHKIKSNGQQVYVGFSKPSKASGSAA